MASLETELRESSSATVVMNPEDFRRLQALDLALDEIASDPVTPNGDLLLKAHSLEDTPTEPVEDPAEIRALLGL